MKKEDKEISFTRSTVGFHFSVYFQNFGGRAGCLMSSFFEDEIFYYDTNPRIYSGPKVKEGNKGIELKHSKVELPNTFKPGDVLPIKLKISLPINQELRDEICKKFDKTDLEMTYYVTGEEGVEPRTETLVIHFEKPPTD